MKLFEWGITVKVPSAGKTDADFDTILKAINNDHQLQSAFIIVEERLKQICPEGEIQID